MVQLLFLAARTRIKASHLEDEIAEFESAARLPFSGFHDCNDFVLWVFDYSSGPIKFKMDYRPELNSGLFVDYGIGQISGTPFTRNDLVPQQRSWLQDEIERGYEDLIYENPHWTGYAKRLAGNYAGCALAASGRAKLLFIEAVDEHAMERREVRDLRRHLGRGARYHWQTPRSLIASLYFGASPEALCRSLAHILKSDHVVEFAAFDIGAEYVSKLGELNSLEHWLNPSSRSTEKSPVLKPQPKQQVVVQRMQRWSRPAKR